MPNTTNYKFKKPLGSEFFNIVDQNENWDLADAALKEISNIQKSSLRYPHTTGTGTNLTVTTGTFDLVDGQAFTFIPRAGNNGNSTTINADGKGAKPLYKPATTTAPKTVAGKAVTVWYHLAGDCFFIKASAEGTAVASDVLASKTFCNDDDTGVTGTMPNIGSVGSVNLTIESAEYTIPKGYHNGLGKVKAVISGLIASVIKAGTIVGGVMGTFTSDANAVANEILEGKTAYVNGIKVTGNVPIVQKNEIGVFTTAGLPRGANVYDGFIDFYLNPNAFVDHGYARKSIYGLYSQNIKAGVAIGDGTGNSISGTFTADANAVAGDILATKSAYVNGVKITGTILAGINTPDNVASQKNYVRYRPKTGYYNGQEVYSYDGNFIPENIKAGVNVYGLVGTLIDGTGMLKIASGMSRILNDTQFTITGLAFQPKIVLINAYINSPHWTYYHITKYNKAALGFSDALMEMDGSLALPWKIGNNPSVSLATALTFTTTGFYFKFPSGYQTDVDRVRWIAIG